MWSADSTARWWNWICNRLQKDSLHMMYLIVVHFPIGPPFVGVTLDGIPALSKTLPV